MRQFRIYSVVYVSCIFIRARCMLLRFLSSFHTFPFFIYTCENERAVGKGKGERKFQLTSAINIIICIYSNCFTWIVYFITHTKERVRLLVFLLHKMACIGFLNFKRTKARVRLLVFLFLKMPCTSFSNFKLFLANVSSSFSVPRILLASKRYVPNCTNNTFVDRNTRTYIIYAYIYSISDWMRLGRSSERR